MFIDLGVLGGRIEDPDIEFGFGLVDFKVLTRHPG